MITIYEVSQAADCEGRGSHVVLRTTDHDLAQAVAESQYGNRSMGPNVGSVKPVQIAEDLEDFMKSIKSDITEEQEFELRVKLDPSTKMHQVRRSRALAKLTPEEREVLGLPR